MIVSTHLSRELKNTMLNSTYTKLREKKWMVKNAIFLSLQIGEGDKLINVVLLNGERLNVRVQVKFKVKF